MATFSWKRLGLGVVLAAAACGKPATRTVEVGSVRTEFSIDPDPPFAGDNRLLVTLRDPQGQAVDGAKLDLDYDMPAMGAMPEMKGRGEAKALGNGRYEIDYQLPMNGDWAVTVSAAAPGHPPDRIRLKLSPPRRGFVLLGGSTQPAPAAPMSGMSGMAGMPGMGGAPAPASEGNLLEIPPERQQLIGVTYGTVEKRPLAVKLRAAGHVQVDERALADVTLRYEVYVEALTVAETGKRVVAGQPLLRAYSPDLLAAERELLDVERAGLPHGAHPNALALAARERLRFWDLGAPQIAELERTGHADGTITVRAPASGVVLEKDVVEGTHAMPGMVLYRIGNLGRIWIQSEMYEFDAPFVAIGQPATAVLPALGSRPYEARVTFLAPTLDVKTRTLEARLELRNPGLELKPGMFAEVAIERPLGVRLAVPDAALILSGEHRYAFVDRGRGRLQPVAVRVGALSDGWDEVLEGLAEGERVVTGANFLVASEAQLRGVSARWDLGAEDGGAPDGGVP
ncbi:MAG: efflux RND transporter periplasmic adaptor subunit [Myxococcales bacterium]